MARTPSASSSHCAERVVKHAKWNRPADGDSAVNRIKAQIHDLREPLVERGELLSPPAFAERMGWTRQALSKALAAHRVFFIEHRGERLYPAFYADPKLERSQLHAVTRLLGDLPGGSQWTFFVTLKGSLFGSTPLEALRRGELAEVKEAASGFAER